MAKEFLIEIGTEEIPARYCVSISEQLSDTRMSELAEANNLVLTNYELLLSPRRIVVLADSISQKEKVQKIKGPLYDVAYTNGKPNQIAEKFAASKGVELKDLIEKEENGKKFLFIEKDYSDQFEAQVNSFVNQMLTSLHFEKPMRWDNSGVTFARPIRWIVCMNGSELVNVEFAGLKSQTTTYGNRFQDSPEIKIDNARNYLELMRKNYVIVDHNERRKMIEEVKVERWPDPEESLLTEVTFLVENPIPLLCEFNEEFLKLPDEVVVSVLSKHQKYFPLIENKKLLNKFLVIANHEKETDVIRAGNEKIINGRLRDAVFFSEQDKKRDLKYFLEKTKTIAFQEKLGSMWDKAQRIKEISKKLAELTKTKAPSLEKSAEICKADLATNMVMEFTSLEGTMGRIYFKDESIEEYYHPRTSGDRLPDTQAAQILALADRIDSVYGLFSVGLQPKGNSDPYGLRRDGIAISRILWEKELALTLEDLIQSAEKAHQNKADQQEIIEFIVSRLEQYILESDLAKEIADTNLLRAVIHNQNDLLTRKKQNLEELSKVKDSEEFGNLVEVTKRIHNIAIKNQTAKSYSIDKSKLNDSEKQLLETVQKLDSKKNEIGFADLYELIDITNSFFDNNMVMSENKDERERRLEILRQAHELLEFFLNTEYLLS